MPAFGVAALAGRDLEPGFRSQKGGKIGDTVLSSLRALLALLFVLVPVGLLGCGEDEGKDGAKPSAIAELVPADVPLYAEAVLRPDQEQTRSIEQIAERFPGGKDIGGRIVREINKSISEQSDVPGVSFTFQKDVDPWLGKRAGIFFTSFEDDSDGAAVIEVTDESAAREAIEKAAQTDTAMEIDKEYRGVSYTVETSGATPTAAGIVAKYLVVGSEQGLRDAIDVSEQGGKSLGAADAFQSSIGDLAPGSIAFAYLKTDRVIEFAQSAAKRAGAESGLEQQDVDVEALLNAFGLDRENPAVFGLYPEEDGVRLDQIVRTSKDQTVGEPTELFRELPEDALIAIGAADAGGTLGEVIKAAGEKEAQQFEQEIGVSLEDLGDTIGDVALFLEGSGVTDLGGAAVFEVTDESKATDLLGDARKRLDQNEQISVEDLGDLPGDPEGFTVQPEGVPIPVNVALGGDRLVVGLGDQATEESLEPESPLSESDELSLLEERLGMDATTLVDIRAFVDLIGTLGASSEPDFKKAERYLEPLNALIAGSRRDGEQVISRTIVDLRD